MAEGYIIRNDYKIIDSALGINSNYIDTSNTRLYTNGVVNILSINFLTKGEIPNASTIISNLPISSTRVFSIIGGADGKVYRVRIEKDTGYMSNEIAIPGPQWINGEVVYITM